MGGPLHNKVGDLVPMLEKAFAKASEGVPGPVFLEIPVDVLYPEEIVKEWYLKESGVDKMKGAVGAAAQLAMKGYPQEAVSYAAHLVARRADAQEPACRRRCRSGRSGRRGGRER